MMGKAPYARAAFINAIADEGTKDEAVQFLQETWNELCEARSRIVELEAMKAADFDLLDSTWKQRAERATAEIEVLRAQLATARDDALEEAQKVVDGYNIDPRPQDMFDAGWSRCAESIASAIRALKGGDA